MIGLIFSLINLTRIFLGLLWLYFTEYIEFFDAFALAFLAWVSAQALLGLSSGAGLAIGIFLGIAFLALFRTKIGWWISTGVFSFMWASLIAYMVGELLNVSTLAHWIIVGTFCAYFVWLHDYAIHRKESHARYLAEQKAAMTKE